MHLDRGAVIGRAGHRDLELARQIGKFGMQGRPLPQQLGDGPRIGDLVGGSTGPMIGGDIADAVAGSLDGMHLDFGQGCENVGGVLELDPVELDVLAGGEMAVAPVPSLGDHRELAHLPRRQRAIGNGDAQHIGMKLQIEAVHQRSGRNSSSVSSPFSRRSA